MGVGFAPKNFTPSIDPSIDAVRILRPFRSAKLLIGSFSIRL